jgi:hypothetical protein
MVRDGLVCSPCAAAITCTSLSLSRSAILASSHRSCSAAVAQEEAQRQEMIEAERRARMRHRTLKPLVDANGRGLADKARRTRRSRSAVAEVRPGSRTSNESPIFANTLALFGPASQVPASLLRPREGARRKSSTGASFAAGSHRPSSGAQQSTDISWDATTTNGKVLHKISVCVDQNLSGGIVQLIERVFKWHADNCAESANEITMPELADAFLAAGLTNTSTGAAVVTQSDLRKLFRALEADGRGKVDMAELRSFLVGEHYSLARSKLPPTKASGGGAGVFLRADSDSGPSAAAMERTVWIGGIPDMLIGSMAAPQLKELIGVSSAAQFGDVESVTIRSKPGDKSWGFIIFAQPSSSFSAVVKESITLAWGGSVFSLKVEPLAMRREMDAEWRQGNEGGALPEMWRKTIENTAHGKHLVKLQAALEAKTGGMAHSTFRLFKEFQRKGKQPSSGISYQEFSAEAEKLNFNLGRTELESLFADLGGEYGGGISLQMLYSVLMGNDNDLTTAVWEQ